MFQELELAGVAEILFDGEDGEFALGSVHPLGEIFKGVLEVAAADEHV